MEQRNKCASRYILSFCYLLLMISYSAFGQEIVIPSETENGNFDFNSENIQLLKNELDLSDLNRINLQQIGNENQSFIQQFSNGDPNLAKVQQKGDENFSDLYQKGNNNATDIYQEGYGNRYLGTHMGDDIFNIVSQYGDGNNIIQILDASSLDFEIYQLGHGHELKQTETRDGIGYKVTQDGWSGGMKIEINQGNIYK